MLETLVQSKLPFNFLIIQDKEEISGRDLLSAFMKHCEQDDLTKEVAFICCENPPEFYSPKKQVSNQKIVFYDFFSDPCQWNNGSIPKNSLELLTLDPKRLSEMTIFIDSLSSLSYQQGFYTMCRELNVLKRFSKKIICIVHSDLFSFEQLEELFFLASVLVTIQDFSNVKSYTEKICEVTYKKPGGKVIKQNEVFFISDDLKVTTRLLETKGLIPADTKKNIESLSTFKLGLNISEEEKRARDQLVLPYLKSNESDKAGAIIYQPEADEFDDDPDDDLDI